MSGVIISLECGTPCVEKRAPARPIESKCRDRRRRPLHLLPLLGLLCLATPKLCGSSQEELRIGALVFIYWPGWESAALVLAERVGNSPQMPGLPRDIVARGEISVYLAPDRARFDSLAPGAPDWSGGIAFPEGDRIVLPTFAARAGGAPLVAVLRHELAHVAVSRYLGSGVARWFQEGYAQLAAGSWGSKDAWALRMAILMGELPSLESLGLDFERGRIGADHAYLLAYTAVDFLYRLGGADGFARLMERWQETGDLDVALRNTYGLTFWQFERLWRKEVARRFGWPLLLSQTVVFWMALTILLLGLGYWKKRRNRRKLAALEAMVVEGPDSDVEPGEWGEGVGGPK